jgi:hypothetical protein
MNKASRSRNSWIRAPSCPRRRRSIQLVVEPLEMRNLLAFSGYIPSQIQQAYQVDQTGYNGSGQTIAIVDAYYDSTVTADLKAFSTKYNLPQLDGKLDGTTSLQHGTFTQDDLSNKTLSPRRDDWTLETALDVEWAHAMAPYANIVLVEAKSDHQDSKTGEPTDLLNAVQEGVNQGATVVSMSWGVNEVSGETGWDSTFFATPANSGVTFVAASGDNGAGTIWPSTSPYVVSVGGTTLKLNTSSTMVSIASETGWGNGSRSFFSGGSGGGVSHYESQPSYQNGIVTQSSTKRANPDVAYDADPNTGFAVYNKGSWGVVGGTSAGTPQWAALVALADQARGNSLGSVQTLSALYGATDDFNDITTGNNGYAAGPGYDLVTGLGTPKAVQVVNTLAAAGPARMVIVSSTTASVPVAPAGRLQGQSLIRSGTTDTQLASQQALVLSASASQTVALAQATPPARVAEVTPPGPLSPLVLVSAATRLEPGTGSPAASARTRMWKVDAAPGGAILDKADANPQTEAPVVPADSIPATDPTGTIWQQAATACFAEEPQSAGAIETDTSLPQVAAPVGDDILDAVAALAGIAVVLGGYGRQGEEVSAPRRRWILKT